MHSLLKRPFFRKAAAGFTLVEIMIVIALIALLAALAVPNFLRARKRAQALTALQALRSIDSAIDQYALEFNRSAGTSVVWSDVRNYLKAGSQIYNSNGLDLFGAAYVGFTVDSVPKLQTSSFNNLSDVAPATFWSPFY